MGCNFLHTREADPPAILYRKSFPLLRRALAREDERRSGCVPPAAGVLREALASALARSRPPTNAAPPRAGEVGNAARELTDALEASRAAEALLASWALAQWSRVRPQEVEAAAGEALQRTLSSEDAPAAARAHAARALEAAAARASADHRARWARAAAAAASAAAVTGDGRLTEAALDLAAACGPDAAVLRALAPTLEGLCGVGDAPRIVEPPAQDTSTVGGARTAALRALAALAGAGGLSTHAAARWAPTLSNLATTATIAEAEASQLLAAEDTLLEFAGGGTAAATLMTRWWLAGMLEAVASGMRPHELAEQPPAPSEAAGGAAAAEPATGGQPSEQQATADGDKSKEGYLSAAKSFVASATSSALQSVGLGSGSDGGRAADAAAGGSSAEKAAEVELAFDKDAVMAAVTIAGRLRQSAVAILRAAKSAPPRPPPDTASKVPEQGAGATAAAATSESSNSSWSSLLGYGKSSEPQPPTPGVPPLAGEGAADGVPAAVDAEALYAGLKVLGNLLASDLESVRHSTALELGILQLLECALKASARARAAAASERVSSRCAEADAVDRQVARCLSALALDVRCARTMEQTAWPAWLRAQSERLEVACAGDGVPMKLRESLSHARCAERNLAAVRELAKRGAEVDALKSVTERRAAPELWRYGDSIHLFRACDANVDPRSEEDTPVIDIVFLHGLLGDPFDTWRCGPGCGPGGQLAENAPATTHDCWPADWLAEDLGPRARILSAGFKTALLDFEGHTPPLQGLSRHLLPQLLDAGVGERPVVFVTHSLGGLLCKQLLADAAELDANAGAGSLGERAGALSRRVTGLLFYSVPHFGSPVADVVPPGAALQRLARISPAVAQLRSNLPEAEALNATLAARHKLDPELRVLSLVETEPLNLRDYMAVGRYLTMDIVKIQSAYPGFGEFAVLEAYDHVNIVKPAVRAESAYKACAHFARERLKEAEADANAGL